MTASDYISIITTALTGIFVLMFFVFQIKMMRKLLSKDKIVERKIEKLHDFKRGSEQVVKAISEWKFTSTWTNIEKKDHLKRIDDLIVKEFYNFYLCNKYFLEAFNENVMLIFEKYVSKLEAQLSNNEDDIDAIIREINLSFIKLCSQIDKQIEELQRGIKAK